MTFVDTGFRPYRCKECQRTFSRQDSLSRHERLHTRKDTPHNHLSPPSPPSSLVSQSSLKISTSPFGLATVDGKSPVPNRAQSDHFTCYEEQNTPVESALNVPQSPDLNFDLIWPDSEDLFETLMAWENTNQWQIPFTTLPITSQVLHDNNHMTGANFHDKQPSISSIPNGESHRAVHNVSEMVTTLVSEVCVKYLSSHTDALLVFIGYCSSRSYFSHFCLP